MATTFVTTRRIEFSDTDAAGIAHFSAFFRMMEQAEHELLRSVGLSVHNAADQIGWPRVSAKCDFQSAARFEELLNIEVRITRLGKSSVTYNHRFLRGGEQLATGEITSVCCLIRAGKPPKAITIPAAMAKKLKPFVAEAD